MARRWHRTRHDDKNGSGAGTQPKQQLLSEHERIAHKFGACLVGATSIEARPNEWRGPKEWIVIRMTSPDNAAQSSAVFSSSFVWRHIREKLEAVAVLSVLAATRSYSFRCNSQFWNQYLQDTRSHSPQQSVHQSTGSAPEVGLQYAPRDDAILPRFLLDFSFAELASDMVSLVRQVLLGSNKSMRVSFINAVRTLGTITPSRCRPAVIQVALRFARCKLASGDLIAKIVEAIQAVNECRRTQQRKLSGATISTVYFEVTELDISGIDLWAGDLLQLRRLTSCTKLRLVLDRTITPGINTALSFAALVDSWFDLPRPLSPSPSAAFVQLSQVSLDSCALSTSNVASLFSAIAFGVGIRSLSLQGSFQCCDSRVVSAWLAYAALCSTTRSSLEYLDVSKNLLRVEDAIIVKEILVADANQRFNVLRRVLASQIEALSTKTTHAAGKKTKKRSQKQEVSSKELSPGCSWVQIPAGTIVHLPYSPVGDSAKFVLADAAYGQVVRLNGDTVVVIVGGYGLLAVASSSLTESSNPHVNELHSNKLEVLRMNTMSFDDDDEADAILSQFFVAMALPAVNRLEVNLNPLGSDALTKMIRSCPSLDTFCADGCDINSLQPLIQLYEQGSCRIRNLNLSDNKVKDRDIVRLSRLMLQDDSPASSIRTLRIDQNPICSSALQALLTVVREQPSLVELVLDRAQDPDSRLRRGFYPFEDQSLGIWPLPADHEREFLSAMATRFQTQALEASILQNICTYAGQHMHRRIVWI